MILKKGILINDSIPLFGNALHRFFTSNNDYEVISVIGEAIEIEAINFSNIELIILDVTLYNNSIFKLAKQIRAKKPSLKLLATDINVNLGMAKKCFFYQFDGYIGKQASLNKFSEAFLTIFANQKYIDSSISNSFYNQIFNIKTVTSKKFMLPTKRQMDVLKLIILEHTTQEIAKKLFISKCTVETHRLNLLQKFNVKNTAGLVREAVLLYKSELLSA